jgi:hypothetical protein
VKEAQLFWHQAARPLAPTTASLQHSDSIKKQKSVRLKRGGLTVSSKLKIYESKFPLITSQERIKDGIILGEHSPGIVWRVPYRCPLQGVCVCLHM